MTKHTFWSSLAGFRVFASLTTVVAGEAGGAGTFSEHRVRFERGTQSATVRGKVSREAAILYTLGARAGQAMKVTLDSEAKTVFDLAGPKDKEGQAMASGASEWEGTLPDDGDYKIFVFTEDRAEAPFTLKITIE